MDNDQAILTTLIELKQEVGHINGKLDEIKDAHAKRLDGLEDSDKWQTRITIATIPVVSTLHVIAKKLGF